MTEENKKAYVESTIARVSNAFAHVAVKVRKSVVKAFHQSVKRRLRKLIYIRIVIKYVNPITKHSMARQTLAKRKPTKYGIVPAPTHAPSRPQ